MKRLTISDPETRTADIVSENVERLRELFPEAFTDGKMDFDVLKQLLGDQLDEREEKYGLNWHGKRRARQLGLSPSTATLRPCPEDSVDWDTTQNIIIEGDNLEVLKLLQKPYSGRVKLIYIDPPYNTGNDFVYPDNFQDNIRNYLNLTGQADGAGRKLSTNTEASGRFHTDWLNMMYPRLRLARSLLREDGVIFVSIDSCEVHHLRVILNEIFGEENLIEDLIWKRRYGGGAKEKYIVSIHEHVLMYAREKAALGEIFVDMSKEQVERYYKLRDDKFETLGPYRLQPLEPANSMADRPNLRFPIMTPDGKELWPKRQWLWGRERFEEAIRKEQLFFSKKGDEWTVSRKQYLRESDGSERLTKQASIIEGIYGQQGSAEIQSLLGDSNVFLFPKPSGLIRLLLQLQSAGGIVLDFFAGSGTAGHAVIALNATDAGDRRYVLVQFPEPLDPTNPQQKSAADFCDKLGKPRTIAEITKERLRRTATRVRGEHPMFSGDLGFRALKLDSSNIREWEPNTDELPRTLHESVVHLKADRTEQDILFELLLKLGLDLAVPIEQKNIAGKTVHSVGAGTLLVCLSESVNSREVERLALGIVEWYKALSPAGESTVVFRDSAFADDVAKTNLTAILQQHGLENVRSL